MDLSGDGEVSLPEFLVGLRRFGVTVASSEAKTLFDSWDANQNGSLDLKEVCSGGCVSSRCGVACTMLEEVDGWWLVAGGRWRVVECGEG